MKMDVCVTFKVVLNGFLYEKSLRVVNKYDKIKHWLIHNATVAVGEL